ncbi:MAG: hypothetical protein HYZ40_02860 [Rhodospirillales bacterium]|nr:hypothetical protein [Rhodospirillales bacterium]
MNEFDPAISYRLRCEWFASVQELSDLGLQRRTWLDKSNTNPHWSYVEFCCCYPRGDQLDSAFIEGWLSPSEFEILNRLGRAIDQYSAPDAGDYNHAAILEDPAWRRVVASAEIARRQLLTLVTNADEQRALSVAPSPSLSP